MKRLRFSVVVAAMSALAGGAFAQSAPATCNNATLIGTFGLAVAGTQPAPSVLPNLLFVPGSVEQVIGVAIQVFDGKGNFTQTNYVKGSFSGLLSTPSAGTYLVNPDCSGTLTFVDKLALIPVVHDFVVINGGQEIHSVVVSPQNVMVTTNGRKI